MGPTTVQRYCAACDNKNLIAYFSLRMRETAIFPFRAKIWCHHHVPQPQFPTKRGNVKEFH